jgi:hypothetical protein
LSRVPPLPPGAALARLSLGLSALVLLGFGMAVLLDPAVLRSAGVVAPEAAGAVELRAFYGGLELGLAAFLLLALRRPEWYVPALAMQVLALGGVATARLIGIVLTPTSEALVFASLLVEAAGAALGIVALRRLRARKPAA